MLDVYHLMACPMISRVLGEHHASPSTPGARRLAGVLVASGGTRGGYGRGSECLAWVAELIDPVRGERSAPLSLITHRQAVNGKRDHVQCPGEAVVAMACASEWVRLGAYRPLPDAVLVEGVGKPWPATWRSHLPALDRPLAPVS